MDFILIMIGVQVPHQRPDGNYPEKSFLGIYNVDESCMRKTDSRPDNLSYVAIRRDTRQVSTLDLEQYFPYLQAVTYRGCSLRPW